MADYIIQDTTLDAIAQAINQKAGTQVAMTPAEMVTAIDNIPSGGGGSAQTYSGNIIYQNEDVGDLIIPVDVTNKLFIAQATCVESGVVENGVVVPDIGYVTPHSASGMILAGRIFSPELAFAQTYRYTASVSDETVYDNNLLYYYGNVGSRITPISAVDRTIYTTNIAIKALNAARKWCRTGLYFKFHYEVVMF